MEYGNTLRIGTSGEGENGVKGFVWLGQRNNE